MMSFLGSRNLIKIKLRRMTTMATDVGVPEPSFASSLLRDPSTVCYSRRVQLDEPRREPKFVIRSWNLCGKNNKEQAEDNVRKTIVVFADIAVKTQEFVFRKNTCTNAAAVKLQIAPS